VIEAFRYQEGLHRTVLPNGLIVLSEKIPGVRSVSLGAWVRSASIHEPSELMGVSHMLEHLVFKGTRNRTPLEIALSLESLGGSLDAFTGREHTSFQARVLDEHLEIAADVVADLIFQPLLRGKDLELERKVILEEISMVEDSPDDLVFELHNDAMWGKQPFGHTILGTRETVSAMPLSALRDLHQRAYHPDHIVVAAAGNVDHDVLLDILHRTGWASRPRGATPVVVASPVPLPPRRQIVPRESSQTHIVLGSTTVPYRDPRRYAIVLADVLIGGGMSSRLFQRVREELGLAYSVYSYQFFHEAIGVHGVYLGTSPETAAQATDVVMEELAGIAHNGLPEEEIASGRRQLKGQLTLSMESVSSRMFRAASVELYGDRYRTLDELLAEIDGIDADTVAAVCRDYFAPDRQTILGLGRINRPASFSLN
jgi:predicted Zn-dependent peptidase